MTQDDLRAQHDQLYKEASSAVFPMIKLFDRPDSQLTAEAEGELRRGIGLFERLLKINSRDWASAEYDHVHGTCESCRELALGNTASD
jgi:hypothetical protein